MSFFQERIVKATRKLCHCYWCGESIPVGSSKVYTSCVYEGDFFATDYHPECHAAGMEWIKAEYGGCSGELPDQGSMQRGKKEEKL